MDHPHSHHRHPRSEQPTWPWGRTWTLALLASAVALTVIGMILLWPHDPPRATQNEGPARVLGTVISVVRTACPELPDGQDRPPGLPTECGSAAVRLADGPDAGQQVTTELPFGPGAVKVTTGDDVVLYHLQDSPGGQSYSIADHQRSSQLWILGAAFALSVLAFGRWRGLWALVGLALTFAVLLLFIVPAILDGRSPVLVAIVGATAIMLSVLYLTHGFNPTTTIAVAGTLASLTITAALSAMATGFTSLSGIADETSSYLNITQGDVNMQGLLLAGIVIGSLGVLDDVTVTQSATVTELARANSSYGFRQLYTAATRIGRAHIASVINTIVLAYAGASLPLMLLFAAGSTPASELLTGELIAQELVRSAVGTMGLIAAVPITTALAAAFAARHQPSGTQTSPRALKPSSPESHENGKTAKAAQPAVDPWMAFVEGDARDPGR